jgi:copper(I)-binding protein
LGDSEIVIGCDPLFLLVGGVLELSMLRTLTAAVLAFLIVTAAQAHDYKLGALEIKHPWTRATPKSATVAGGYLKITNTGSTSDRLTGGAVEVARKFEVHEMSMDGGVMKMRELKNGVEIAPGATIELKPGSYHIMMMSLSRPLAKGDKIKGSLNFEKAGKVDIEFTVEAMGGMPAGMKH